MHGSSKRRILLGILALTLIAAAAGSYGYASTLQKVSNDGGFSFSLGCGAAGPVCIQLLPQNSGFNASFFSYSLRALNIGSTDLTGLYWNTTVVEAPAGVVFHLNQTEGTAWLNGPFSLTHNQPTVTTFNVDYNGTVGSYVFSVNVVK